MCIIFYKFKILKSEPITISILLLGLFEYLGIDSIFSLQPKIINSKALTVSGFTSLE